MRSAAVLLTAIAFGGLAIAETTVDRVIVRQQWPWSTDVLIEYTLAGGTDRVDIDIHAAEGERQIKDAGGVAPDQKRIPVGLLHCGL